MAVSQTPVAPAADPALSRQLILDELFDLRLYQELHRSSAGGLRRLLEELVAVETRHLAFWQNFFNNRLDRLDVGRRLKLRILSWACRLLGPAAVHLVLEAIEIYGIRKYLSLWEIYRDTALGQAVREILNDEFEHEDVIVSQMTERKIDPGKIRSIFLGFNDGLVEVLGAVSGFFAAFRSSLAVLAAACTVAVAGALSMAAGAYVASGSESEMKRIERGKALFLKTAVGREPFRESPGRAALLVGVSYLVGAVVPVLPVAFGADHIGPPLAAAGGMIVLVSLVLAFLSGMDVKKRIGTNLVIMAAAVGVTYAIGALANRLFGVNI
jgi:vacuolar iron transporter family protein